jgi:hypothetical protein
MDANEIVVHEINRHHVRMVLGLLRKGIREVRHAPIAHAHRKILTLYKRRADVLGIGFAFDAMLVRPRANCRAIAALTFRRFTIHLDQRRIVNVRAKRAFDGLRCAGVSESARARPPFKPPFRPRATAA